MIISRKYSLKNTDIAFIQETHFRNEEDALQLKCDWAGNVFHNSISSKSCGVVILVNKNLNFVLSQQFKDNVGPIICIEALINGVEGILCKNLCSQ